MPAVVLAATLDTKADEIAFARAELQRLGQRVLVIDCGVLADPPIAPDIAAAEVARAGGSDLSLLRRQRDRAVAIPAMMAGLQAVLADWRNYCGSTPRAGHRVTSWPTLWRQRNSARPGGAGPPVSRPT